MALKQWYRIVAFTVSAVGMAVLSVVAAFNVYANALKSEFNYTQSEVQRLASFGVVGQFLGIPAGMLFHQYGPRATSLVGLILTVLGFMLLYMTIRLSHVFASYSFVVTIFYFIGNHGFSYTYLGFLLANMELASDAHRGKITVALNTLFQAPFWPFIYSFAFLGEDKEYQSQDNIEGFFLTLSIAFVIVNVLGLVVLRKKPTPETQAPPGDEEMEPRETFLGNATADGGAGGARAQQNHVAVGGSTDTGPKEKKSILSLCLPDLKQKRKGGKGTKRQHSYIDDTAINETAFIEGHENERDRMQPNGDTNAETPKTMSILRIFVTPAFQFAMWVPVLSFGVNISMLSNLTAVLSSVSLSHWFSLTITACPLIALAVSFMVCTLSSMFAQRVRPSVVSLACVALQLASQIFLIFFMDNFTVLFTCATVEISAALTIFSLIPTIISNELGSDNFNRVWGYVLLLLSLSTLALQNAFGAIYDSKVPAGETNCFGSYCFADCFLMTSIVTGGAVLFNVGLIEVGW